MRACLDAAKDAGPNVEVELIDLGGLSINGDLAAGIEARLHHKDFGLVLEAARKIPFGETRSYGALARSLGTAARAVGASDARILLRHVLPNLLGPVIVQATCHDVDNRALVDALMTSNGKADRRKLGEML